MATERWAGVFRRTLAKVRHAVRNQGGQALVETALTASILAALLVGAIEFGLAAYASIEVASAAKAGVAYGASSATAATDLTGIQNAAANEAADITLDTTTVSTSYACSDGSTPSGTPETCSTGAMETILTVNTQTTFKPSFHVPGLPTSYTFHGQAIQKVAE